MRLEINAKLVKDPSAGSAVMVTPPLDEDFWLARVPLSESQALVCFQKFGTIGIGFQREEDWNTNLPYSCPAREILSHIAHNKGDAAIPDSDCLAAIELLREFARAEAAKGDR